MTSHCLICFKKWQQGQLINNETIIQFLCQSLNVDFEIFKNEPTTSTSTLTFPLCSDCINLYYDPLQVIYEEFVEIECQLEILTQNIRKQILEFSKSADPNQFLPKTHQLFRNELMHSSSGSVNRMNLLKLGEEAENVEKIGLGKANPNCIEKENSETVSEKENDTEDDDNYNNEECEKYPDDVKPYLSDSDIKQEYFSEEGAEDDIKPDVDDLELSSKVLNCADFLDVSQESMEIEECNNESSENSENSDSEEKQKTESIKKLRTKQKRTAGESYKRRDYNVKCDVCMKTFPRFYLLEIHYRATHKHIKQDFVCSRKLCGKVFNFTHLLKKHEHFHERMELFDFACKECERVWNREKNWRAHLKQHNGVLPPLVLISCRFCKHISRYPPHIRKHELENHVEQLVHKCDICNKSYATLPILTSHLNTHSSKGPYSCTICQNDLTKQFIYAEALEDHLIQAHVPIKPEDKEPDDSGRTCPHCGAVFQDRSYLKTHINRSHLNLKPNLSCSFCPEFSVTTTKSLLDHVLKVHELPGAIKTLECNKCPEKFVTNYLLERHLIGHKFDKKKPNRCRICEARFAKEEDLQRHMDIEHKEGAQHRFECRFSECRRKFSTKQLRTIHERNHPELFTHVCDTCGKSYTDEKFLLTHLKTHDNPGTTTPSLDCCVCKQSFSTREFLAEHLRVHTAEGTRTCKLCQKSFVHTENLMLHMIREHNAEKQHECNICKKRFAQKSNLNNHIKINHNDEKYVCEFCPKTFTATSSLKNHKSNVHGIGKIQPTPKVQCDVCGKSVTRHFFKTHMKIHSGSVEKNKQCSYCDKKFRTGFELRQHTLTHTKEKPFKCHICDRGFTQRHSLRGHLETHKKDGSFFPAS